MAAAAAAGPRHEVRIHSHYFTRINPCAPCRTGGPPIRPWSDYNPPAFLGMTPNDYTQALNSLAEPFATARKSIANMATGGLTMGVIGFVVMVLGTWTNFIGTDTSFFIRFFPGWIVLIVGYSLFRMSRTCYPRTQLVRIMREVRVIENRLTMDNRNTGKWVVSQFTHINFGVAKLEITLRNPAAYQAAVAAAAVAALPSLPTATPVAGIGTTPPVSTGPSVYGDHGIMMTSLGGTTDPPRTGGSGGGGGGGGAGASTAASAPVLIDGKPQRQQNIDAFIL